MANGQQKAQQNVESFILWTSTLTDDCFRQMVYRGNLSRTEVAKGIGCAKSALLQNPKLRELLENLEHDLRQKGVLPNLTKEAKKAKSQDKQYDPTNSMRIKSSKRVAELEEEILQLKMKLSRFTELSEVMAELGLDSHE